MGFAQRSFLPVSRFPVVLTNNSKSKDHKRKFISGSLHCGLLDSVWPAVAILQCPSSQSKCLAVDSQKKVFTPFWFCKLRSEIEHAHCLVIGQSKSHDSACPEMDGKVSPAMSQQEK